MLNKVNLSNTLLSEIIEKSADQNERTAPRTGSFASFWPEPVYFFKIEFT